MEHFLLDLLHTGAMAVLALTCLEMSLEVNIPEGLVTDLVVVPTLRMHFLGIPLQMDCSEVGQGTK